MSFVCDRRDSQTRIVVWFYRRRGRCLGPSLWIDAMSKALRGSSAALQSISDQSGFALRAYRGNMAELLRGFVS